MRSVAEVLFDREPSPAQAAIGAKVAAIVANWAAGRTDVWDVRRRCSGQERAVLTRWTPPDASGYDALMRCLDALIDSDAASPGGYHHRTKHGAVSDAEIWEAGGEIATEGDRRVIRFPGRRGVFHP